MKFVHVSIFTVSSLSSGIAEPDRLSGLSFFHGGDKDTYLKKVFPDLPDEEKNRVKGIYDDLGINDQAYYKDDTGAYCFPPGQTYDKQLPRQFQRDGPYRDKLGKAGPHRRQTEEEAAPKWCCSGKVSNRTIDYYGKDNRDDWRPCDCKHKGEKVGPNGGFLCCSHYATMENGVAVCGGIPPTGVNQPELTAVSAVAAANMFQLDTSDCMFPESGDEEEVSARVTGWVKGDRHGAFMEAGTLRACKKRACQARGKKPTDEKSICCGGTSQDDDWNRNASSKGTKCGCGHYEAKLSPYTTATAKDCCSGRFVEKDSMMCDCILDHQERPPDAEDTDCCSGKVSHRDKKAWCQPHACTEQGKLMKGKGGHCCAKNSTGLNYSDTEPCGCVPGGMVQTEKNGARCCSKKIDKKTNKCEWKPPKGKVEEHFNETECFSGKMNGDKLCLCMEPKSTVRDKATVTQNPTNCCSGYTISNENSPHFGLCGCIKTGQKLGFGSDESHCCSGKAVDGKCVCTPPGGKYSAADGMTSDDCCSGRAGAELCKCSASNQTADGSGCCSEVRRGRQCPCIPDGHALPQTEYDNPDAVCCSKRKDGEGKCSDTCGKKAESAEKKIYPDECMKNAVLAQLEKTCKLPGDRIEEKFRCEKCAHSDNSYYDSYPMCKVRCCDVNAEIQDDMCKCTSYGVSYDFRKNWPLALEGATSAAKCCGRNVNGEATVLPNGICGCSDIGASTGIGGSEKDCCSGKMKNGVCVPGSCTKKGQPGKCCRISTEMKPRRYQKKCPCFHTGEVLNSNDDVNWDNCCSGKVNAAGTACGCVSDPKQKLPDTAVDIDCCSGKRTADKQYCTVSPSKCLEVGIETDDEKRCCSERKDDKNKCACVPSGKIVGADGTERDCCSRTFEGKTRKCAYLKKGGSVPNGTTPEDVCESRRLADGTGNETQCGCVGTNGATDDSSQCCSNDLGKFGKCRCIQPGQALNGGSATFCCSGLARDGVCLCSPPGAPPVGHASETCCTHSYGAKKLHCGCYGPSIHPLSPVEGEHCCGGFFNYRADARKCNCVQTGRAVPKWMPEGSCCSGKKDADVCVEK